MTEGRTCTKCGEFKLFLNFESQGIKTRADGSTYRKYRAQCKLCMKDKVQQWTQNYRTRNGDAIRARNRKQWRIEHPPKEPKPKRTIEEAREYQRNYYRTHKEYYAEYTKKYYADNKEKIDACVRKWQKENKERHNETRLKWREQNREKVNAQQKTNRDKLFAENPERIRALRRAKKAKQKAKDPQAWNAKMAKYNASCQKRMVNELSDAYVRARLVIPSDGSRRKISAKDIPQSLVEAKRVQLMILRSLKNEKHE